MNSPAPDFGVTLPTQPWSALTTSSTATLIAITAALTVVLMISSWRARRQGRRGRSHVLAGVGVLSTGAAGYLVAAVLPSGQIAFPESDPPLIASLPGVTLQSAPARTDPREAAALLEDRYGLSGLDRVLLPRTRLSTPEDVAPGAIARDLIVSGPSGPERCTLSPVALVDGDRTFERVAILCGGRELPAAPDHSPPGRIAQAA